MSFGHNTRGIQTICVELSSIIHANFHVAATVPPDRRSVSLYADFDEHYETQINTKSIELAANLRSLFDRCALLANPKPLEQAKRECRAIVFIEGTGPTTLRECTNKIIHANYFTFQYARYETVGEGGQRFSNSVHESIVEITGSHLGQRWRCTLDLLAFAQDAHRVAQELGETYGQ